MKGRTQVQERNLAEDSLSLFDDGIEQQFAKQKPGLWLTATAIVAGFIVALAGAYWVYDTYLSHYGENPMVYFEIKAIDQNGHPVAGAGIAIDDEQQGITDSFGEWRKYVAVERGAGVRVSIQKESAAGLLRADKNLVVPLRPPQNGDVSIVKTIALATDRTQAEPTAIKAVPAENTAVLGAADSAQQAAAGEVESLTVADEAAVAIEEVPAFEFDRVNFKVKARQFAPGNALGQQRYDFLRHQTLAELRKVAIRAGIAIDRDSPWQVELTHLSVGSGSSLIRVESRYQDQAVSYLRNYYPTAELTAQKVFGLLKVHAWKSFVATKEGARWYVAVPNGTAKFWQPKPGNHLVSQRGETLKVITALNQDGLTKYEIEVPADGPCASDGSAINRCEVKSANFQVLKPKPAWSQQSVVVDGAYSGDSQLYFSGFEGQALPGNGLRYWGETGQGTNLTVVKNDTVVLRKKLINGKPGSLRVSIPASTVARR